MKEQIIQLDEHDDVATLLDKLGWIRADQVLIQFPTDPSVSIVQNKLDLVLIDREAKRHNAAICFVTRNSTVKDMASDFGIPCFSTTAAARGFNGESRGRTRRSFREIGQPVPLSAELASAATRLNVQRFALPPQVYRAIGRGFGIVVGMLTVIGLVFGIPAASIRINPAKNQISVTTLVHADPALTEVNLELDSIPARLVGVMVEASATVETTGSTEIPTKHSVGLVLFTNLTPFQVTIPSGTVVRTSAAEPIRFATVNDITIAGAQGATVQANIEAITPGLEGNVPENRINQVEGPLASQLVVINPDPTSGGASDAVRGISQMDRDQARSLVIQQVHQRALAQMEIDPDIQLQATEFIAPETLRIVIIESESFDGEVDQPRESVSFTMRAVVQGIAIDEQLARQVVYAQVARKIGAGFEVKPDTFRYERNGVTDIDEVRRVTFSITASGTVTSAIDERDAQRLVLGTTPEQAIQVLKSNFQLETDPVIQLWPQFLPILPLNSARIELIIE
jgi:hypothetical protein